MRGIGKEKTLVVNVNQTQETQQDKSTYDGRKVGLNEVSENAPNVFHSQATKIKEKPDNLQPITEDIKSIPEHNLQLKLANNNSNTPTASVLDKKNEASSVHKKQMRVNNWLEKYQNNYGAHAVWPDETSVKSILESGQLLSAEDLFRKNKAVQFELGIANCRKKIEHGQIGQYVDALKKSDIPIIEINVITVDTAKEFGDAEYELDLESWEEQEFASPQEKESKKPNRNEKKYTHFDSDAYETYFVDINGQRLSFSKRSEIKDRMKNELGIPYYLQDVVIDQCRKKNIDQALAKVYDEWKKKKRTAESNPENYNNEKINFDALEQETVNRLVALRNRLIHAEHLSNVVRMSPNRIYWHYGDLVILKGSPNIGYKFPSGLLNLEEITTMFSFQNGGSPSSLDLNKDDVLIIAPRTIAVDGGKQISMESYQDQYPNLIFFDELSEEQWNIFKIPSKSKS